MAPGRPRWRALLPDFQGEAHVAVVAVGLPRRCPRPGRAQAGLRITDHAQALAWFTAEHPVLLAARRQAADAGLHTHTWQPARTLTTY
ncbi:hypothetical protein ACFWBR_06010 [Streptomyces sp. NPDC060006]|uniref:hypothetical protein n=1 Tax=unclassified Streptomyces TaxID=2593676 RepID=UPI0036A0E9E0